MLYNPAIHHQCRNVICHVSINHISTDYNYAQPRLLYWRISSLGVCDTPLRSPSNTVGAKVCGGTNPPLQNKSDIPYGNAIITNTLSAMKNRINTLPTL